MAVSNDSLALNFANTLNDTPEIIFTADANGKGVLITAFTAVNNDVATRSYQAYIVESGGSATNPLIPTRNLTTLETDQPVELLHFLEPGWSVYVSSSTAGTINFTMSGRVFT